MAGSPAMADNVASTLCYALGFITGIIFLVLEPYSKNRVVRFHAFQSIFFSIAAIVVRWGLGLLIATLWSVSGFFLAFGLLSAGQPRVFHPVAVYPYLHLPGQDRRPPHNRAVGPAAGIAARTME